MDYLGMFKLKMKSKKQQKKVYKNSRGDEIMKEFIAFGNRKKTFLSVSLATIIMTIISIPLMIQEEYMLKYFLIVWILEVIYILLYLDFKRKEKQKHSLQR
jgi:hypothetical protein